MSNAQTETTPTLTRRAGPKPANKLYVKAIFSGYKRGQRVQHENTSLLKLEGVYNQKDAKFYIGKRAVFVFKGKNKVARNGGKKTNIRTIWGRITKTHGNSGVVRAKFHHNLPPKAIGKRVRVMLYPSNI